MFRPTFVAAAALAVAVSFQAPAFAQDDAIVAKIGSVEIHQSDLDTAIANLSQQYQQLPEDQRKIAALSQLVDIKLVAKQAEQAGLQNSEDFKKRMAYLQERELHNAYLRDQFDKLKPEEVKARYEKEVASLPKEEEVHARHILVKTEDEAKEIIKQLDGGKDFVELAKEKSEDSSKSDGGDLGYFTKGRMVPEFEQAAFTLGKGAYTKTPVKSQFGWHVIKVEDKRDAQPPAFDQVEPQVRQIVMQEKYSQIIENAKKDQTVEIMDETLRKGYEDMTKGE
ncbi:peptidylprolyl isomerase [Rhizobium sp. SSA_523]|uniref:peptidylprolyl isomerase n=1 Tax=Rhizobium sp. SSA_523 TaxID=2952477 RepID=UPI002091A0C4|nr:peptidylprolyl isomerase [Rhizobium sp. SSA_523]MCO5733697.1 peptidylprolyl isomerase [Rhizobium sp. SSA_523]WKC23013.1 peptidylprolyl isomerase [Rhizobium sp. SSA_523]